MAIDVKVIGAIFARLPSLITQAEAVFGDVTGAGSDKLAGIQAAVTEIVSHEDAPEFLKTYWPRISTYISFLVTLYNLVGKFRK